jgi:hypothetical protein
MRRWMKWLVLAVVVLVVAAAVVGVVTVRPGLADARDQVDRTWVPLRPPLVARYQALGGVDLALVAAGARDRSVTKDLTVELGRWQRLARTDEPAAQAPLADNLEALALRVKANINAADRLKADPGLMNAVGGFDRAIVSPPAVAAYNRAVRAYEHKRGGTAGGLVATVFGFDARPVLTIGGA